MRLVGSRHSAHAAIVPLASSAPSAARMLSSSHATPATSCCTTSQSDSRAREYRSSRASSPSPASASLQTGGGRWACALVEQAWRVGRTLAVRAGIARRSAVVPASKMRGVADTSGWRARRGRPSTLGSCAPRRLTCCAATTTASCCSYLSSWSLPVHTRRSALRAGCARRRTVRPRAPESLRRSGLSTYKSGATQRMMSTISSKVR